MTWDLSAHAGQCPCCLAAVLFVPLSRRGRPVKLFMADRIVTRGERVSVVNHRCSRTWAGTADTKVQKCPEKPSPSADDRFSGFGVV